jgi:hypothetical protein
MYKARKSPLAGECVVAAAVYLEPFSALNFTVIREINREIGKIRRSSA